MKTLIFMLLIILCFSCSKETEPLNPLQTAEIQGRGGGNSHAVAANVQIACLLGENTNNITANAVVNVNKNKGEFRLQLMEQNQLLYREIIATIQHVKVENGVCWMVGQVTTDSKGCAVGNQYRNHGEYCPYRDGDGECECECKCECTCDCVCLCQGDCTCDCACECCQCLQHRLKTRLRGPENQGERARIRSQLRNRDCACTCDSDCQCECAQNCPGEGCQCCCHQQSSFNCHDWCCRGDCCNCPCCQNGGECLMEKNQTQNRQNRGAHIHNVGDENLNQWQTQHMMSCRVGQQICLRLCDGAQCPDGCDKLAWRWGDEKEPALLQDRLQWQLCSKTILQGDITIN